MGCRLKLFSDNTCVYYLLRKILSDPNTKLDDNLAKIVTLLHENNAEICYIKSEENTADYISRSIEESTEENKDKCKKDKTYKDDRDDKDHSNFAKTYKVDRDDKDHSNLAKTYKVDRYDNCLLYTHKLTKNQQR